MDHYPYDFQLWNALVNLLKESGVNSPSERVQCWEEAGAYQVEVAAPIRPAMAQALKPVLLRPIDPAIRQWTLSRADAVKVVCTDVI